MWSKKGDKSIGWKPWITSLLVEIASIFLTKYENNLESNEFSSRSTKLGSYLLRDPFFPHFLRFLEKFLFLFDNFSLLSWISTAVRSCLLYANKYYFMNAST